MLESYRMPEVLELYYCWSNFEVKELNAEETAYDYADAGGKILCYVICECNGHRHKD